MTGWMGLRVLMSSTMHNVPTSHKTGNLPSPPLLSPPLWYTSSSNLIQVGLGRARCRGRLQSQCSTLLVIQTKGKRKNKSKRGEKREREKESLPLRHFLRDSVWWTTFAPMWIAAITRRHFRCFRSYMYDPKKERCSVSSTCSQCHYSEWKQFAIERIETIKSEHSRI